MYLYTKTPTVALVNRTHLYESIVIRTHITTFAPATFQRKCTFAGVECNVNDWELVDTALGVCAQFNGAGSSSAHAAEVAGSAAGLSLLIDTNDPMYSLVASPGVGVRILLHPKHEYPQLETLSTKISAGFISSLSMTYNSIHMLPEPYGSCKDDVNYYQENCFLECEAEYLVRQCGCQMVSMTKPNVRYCDPEEFYNCGSRYHAEFQRNPSAAMPECNCPSACHRSIYTSQLSNQRLSTLTREALVSFIMESVYPQCLNSSYTPPENSTECSRDYLDSYIDRNFVQLDIYFSTLLSEEITVQPAYSVLALLCDVGGALGLILGSTILTIFEFVDFFIIAGTNWTVAKIARRTKVNKMLAGATEINSNTS